MKFKDILNMDIIDIMKLSRNELSKAVQTLNSVANKRLKRLESSNLKTPAYRSVEKSGGKFTTKGKSINQLREEHGRVSRFLNAKTSTVKGAIQVKKEAEERIGGNLTPEQLNNLYKAYNRLEESQKAFVQQYGSNQLQSMLRSEIIENGGDIESLFDYGMEVLNKDYEENEDNIIGGIRNGGTSGFFEL